jgi:hypothetical protein
MLRRYNRELGRWMDIGQDDIQRWASILQRWTSWLYEVVSKSFGTGRLERELQMIELCATRCSCIATLWVSLVSFAAITLCVASQRVLLLLLFISLSTQSGNFWIHTRITMMNLLVMISDC